MLSHEEYMAAELDTEVTIQAYVQAKQSYYAEQGTATVYLQDQDGAYFAYDMACTQEEYDAMTEGTCIQVTGFKSEWSGEIEIMDGQLDQIVEGDTFVAEPLDATELLGTDELEQHQNEKVSFTGLTVAPAPTPTATRPLSCTTTTAPAPRATTCTSTSPTTARPTALWWSPTCAAATPRYTRLWRLWKWARPSTARLPLLV